MIDDAVEEEVERMRRRLSLQRLPLEAYLRSTNQTEQALRDELRPGVTTRLRDSLILREIAEREGIAVSTEQLDSEIEEIIADAPDREMALEVYKADTYMRSMISSDMFERAVQDRLFDIATEGRGVTNAWDRSTRRRKPPVRPADESASSPEAIGIAASAEPVAARPDGAQSPDEAGACPEGYPIKGNASSLIYHAPGTSSFDVTEPEICFATAEAAEAAGYRAPRSAADNA
jgi:hypothetical protein